MADGAFYYNEEPYRTSNASGSFIQWHISRFSRYTGVFPVRFQLRKSDWFYVSSDLQPMYTTVLLWHVNEVGRDVYEERKVAPIRHAMLRILIALTAEFSSTGRFWA